MSQAPNDAPNEIWGVFYFTDLMKTYEYSESEIHNSWVMFKPGEILCLVWVRIEYITNKV